jgi:hypothetical protein
MTITNPVINWMKGYGNSPYLEVTVDELPKMDELIFTRIADGERGNAYFAKHDSGYVRYFYHAFNNNRGFGGSVFSGKLDTGETFNVKGPWSSNSQAMNALGFPRSMEITFRMQEGYLLAAHMLEDKVLELIKQAGADYAFTADYGSEDEITDNHIRWNDRVAIIKHPGMTIRESQMFKNI